MLVLKTEFKKRVYWIIKFFKKLVEYVFKGFINFRIWLPFF